MLKSGQISRQLELDIWYIRIFVASDVNHQYQLLANESGYKTYSNRYNNRFTAFCPGLPR